MGILRILFSAALLFFAGAFSALADQAVAKEMQKPGTAVPKQLDPIDAEDLFDLAWKYDNGKGVAQDKTEAVRFFRKAANLGSAEAMANLGVMYHDGEGIAQDKAEAARLYRKAVELGQAAAMANLAVMYFAGDGVARDMTEAVRLISKAADLGNADATFNLALMYDNGAGVVQDQRRAAELIVSAIKMPYALSSGEGCFASWSEKFRKELKMLLKEAAPTTGSSMAKPTRLWSARSRYSAQCPAGEAGGPPPCKAAREVSCETRRQRLFFAFRFS